MTAASEDYERFVRDMVEALLHAQGLTTIKVDHDVMLKGLSGRHQIDVYWEYRLAGVTYRTAISCKQYRRTVTKGKVQELKGVLDDLPGVRGVVVTTTGFQRGAVEFATVHQIGLKVIRAPQPEDWAGRFKTIKTIVTMAVPKVDGLQIMFDKPWAEMNLTNEQRDQLLLIGPDHSANEVDDVAVGKRIPLLDLVNAAFANAQDGDVHVTTRWQNAFLVGPGFPRAKLESTTVTGRISTEAQQEIVLESSASAIIKDALAGTLLFVDPDGTVSGDVEAEGLVS